MVVALPKPLFPATAGGDLPVTPPRAESIPDLSDRVLVLGNGRVVQTIGEAVEYVLHLMTQQIDVAAQRGTNPNEPTSGDGAARSTFYTLLPDQQQREVFLQMAGQMRVWPRLRSLFGAPPYGFLMPQDGGVLRATGIAAGRSNMTHESFQTAASYAQFGTGQLTDELEREYRVIRNDAPAPSDPLPFNLAMHGRAEVMLQCRVPRRNRQLKMEMIKDESLRHRLTFPRPGERITLKQTRRVLVIQGRPQNADTRTILKIRRVVPRSLGAATAALFAIIE